MSKRILITGAAGFVASHLCRHILRTTDWKIVGLDRLDPAGSLSRLTDIARDYPDRFSLVHHDLRAEVNDGTAIELFTGRGKFEFARFDYIAHLAASSHVDRAKSRPLICIADNVTGTANLLEFIRLHAALAGGGRVWHMSTDEVMGPAPAGVAFRPQDRTLPRNVYSASKAGAESLVFAYAETFEIPLVMTRSTNIIAPIACETDPGQDGEKFIPTLVSRLMTGDKVQIHTVDGVPCSRYYVHVHNACTAAMLVMQRGSLIDGTEGTGVYHISGDEELDNIEVSRIAADVLGLPLSYELVERPPGRLKPDLRYCLDDHSLRLLGWTDEIGCRVGLNSVFESYRPRMAKAAE